MAKRETVMLAHKHKGDLIGNWSEKLDGQRAFWIPSTRGMKMSDVPFVNAAKRPKILDWTATGLWSRGFGPIMAPDWWLDRLPDVCLDGELWVDRGMMQYTEKIVRCDVPDARWVDVGYRIIDAPRAEHIVGTGCVEIGSGAKKVTINILRNTTANFIDAVFFLERMDKLSSLIPFDDKIMIGGKEKKPLSIICTQKFNKFDELYEFEKQIFTLGGEGTVVRKNGLYNAVRSWDLQKRKPYIDDEAEVIGYTAGKEKYEGMVGALIVQWGENKFEIASGLTDALRANPYPIGTIVQIRYREVTTNGIPKEARIRRERKML